MTFYDSVFRTFTDGKMVILVLFIAAILITTGILNVRTYNSCGGTAACTSGTPACTSFLYNGKNYSWFIIGVGGLLALWGIIGMFYWFSHHGAAGTVSA